LVEGSKLKVLKAEKENPKEQRSLIKENK